MLDSLTEIASRIGALVQRKRAAYGNATGTSARALALLYPNGVKPHEYGDMLLIARIWDKLSRVATNKDALGESPYSDIAGYGILGVELHQTRPRLILPPSRESSQSSWRRPVHDWRDVS